MLQQTMRCRAGTNTLDLTRCNDHIAQSLTIQIGSHMNDHSVGQFDPHAAAMV
jgi:hypothetical protein